MDKLKSIKYEGGLTFIEAESFESEDSNPTDCTLSVFVPHGVGYLLSEQLKMEEIEYEFEGFDGKQQDKISATESSEVDVKAKKLTGDLVHLCNLDTFRDHFSLITEYKIRLTYEAVIAAPEKARHVTYQLLVEGTNSGVIVTEASLKFDKWPPTDQEEQRRRARRISGY